MTTHIAINKVTHTREAPGRNPLQWPLPREALACPLFMGSAKVHSALGIPVCSLLIDIFGDIVLKREHTSTHVR